MMPYVLLGEKDDWLRHYTSNRISDAQLDAIISVLKTSGLVVDDKGSLAWKDFPLTPSELYRQNLKVARSKPRGKGKKRDDGGSVNDTETDGQDGMSATAHSQDAATTSKQATTERGNYSPLGKIINAIADIELPGLASSCKYKEEPYDTDSEVPGSQHRIGGCLRLIGSTSPASQTTSSRISTSDIAVNFEFKVDDNVKNACDNRWKVLYSAYHNIYSDCRRTHTYSVTIEDHRMALCYFSPSHSAKSKDFSLLDVRVVVHALSLLVFSTVEDLGYDADIRRIAEKDGENNDHLRYVYQVKGRFYKTLKCIDEYDNLIITGRATRVWEVIEVHSFDDPQPLRDAEPRVLRDVWLDDGTRTEDEIQKMIFQACDHLARNYPADNDGRFRGVDQKTKEELRRRLADGSYKELFLTIEADHRGAKSKAAPEGFVAKPDIFAAPEYSSKGATKKGVDAHRSSASTPRSIPAQSAPTSPQKVEPRDYKPKQRNFVVYKEVCRALHELDDMYPVAQALLDCVLALQILFMISWIHRDVSSGNILYYNGHGKLGDLEYAKPFDVNVGRRSSDPKTGTPIFMAVEVQWGRPLFEKGETSSVQDSTSDSDGIESDWEVDESVDKPTTVPLCHNFQHDLESVFWILTWLAVTHTGGQNYANTARRLFHSRTPDFTMHRFNALRNEDCLREQLHCLRQDLPKGLKVGLLKMREKLHFCYANRKARYGDMASYARLYNYFRRILVKISTATPTGRVRLVQPPRPENTVKSGYGGSHSRTRHLDAKMQDPEGVQLSPHKVTSLKRVRGRSQGTAGDDEARPEKRHAQG